MVGPSRCVDAFSIALNQAGRSGWISSTLQLQLASLQFCVLCRSVSTLHLIVKEGMHTLLLEDAPASGVKVKEPLRTRVPIIRPLILTWKHPVSCFTQFSSEAFANVQQLTFGYRFNDEEYFGEIKNDLFFKERAFLERSRRRLFT